MKWNYSALFILFFATIFTNGCNLMGFLDSPGNDEQNLATALACFNETPPDYTCATNYLNKLSPAYSDTKNSQLALVILDQNSLGIVTMIDAVGKSNNDAGAILTQLAAWLTSRSPGQTLRLNFFSAYQYSKNIQNVETQGFTKFMTCLALASEILAEGAQTTGQLLQTDLALTPSTCISSGPLNASCGPPAGNKITAGSSALSFTLATATPTDMSGVPVLYMLQQTLTEMLNGVTALNATGGIFGNTQTMAQALSMINPTLSAASEETFRFTLIDFGIGD